MKKLTDVQPQNRNLNRHTARGMKTLEESIQQDGWIGAITVAADGETFDGSARVETGVSAGFDDAIVVESDGSQPVIVRRTDIPTATDPRAVRLGIAANRVAELNLDWNVQELAALAQETDLSQLFHSDELATLLEQAGSELLNNAPPEQPVKTQWLVVIECVDEAQQVHLLERLTAEGLTCRALQS